MARHQGGAPAKHGDDVDREVTDIGGILAVVVSHNGLTKTRATVAALRAQVGRVCIVDNGSDTPSLEVLSDLEELPDVSVIRLGSNRGIGCALNVGVAEARHGACAWVLTMDQDSTIHPGMIEAYGSALAKHPDAVSLSPRIAGFAARRREDAYVVGSAITSGNLVKVAVFDEVGPYNEDLFIDGVDFEFCLRLRRAGHAIHRVPAAVMSHQLGEGRDEVPRLKGFYAEHPPLRRYYMFRNFMYLTERYTLRFPLFILKLAVAHALLMVLIAFHDPRRLASYRGVLKGLSDYCARRIGPYRGRAL
jgi:rhamnosyltransferase